MDTPTAQMEVTEVERKLGVSGAPGRISVLDGWRGAAILIVVIHNAAYVLEAPGTPLVTAYHVVTASWWVGVSLFFVLSGFLITGILLDSLGSESYFRNFYIRRTLRIFPLYYAFLVIALVVVPSFVDAPEWEQSIRANQVWYWLYLSNWTPLLSDGGIAGLPHVWSLAVEEQFYLVWPVVVAWAAAHDPRRLAIVSALVAVVAFAVRFVMFSMGADPEYMYTFTIARADSLAFGALLAVGMRRDAWRATLKSHLGRVLVLLLVILVLVTGASGGFEGGTLWIATIGQTAVALVFAGGLLATLEPTNRWETSLTRAVDQPWLRTLGKYSYAMYIFHVPLHVLMRDLVTPLVNRGGTVHRLSLTSLYSASVLLASLALAVASWNILERPCLDLKNRIAPRRATPAP